MKWILITHILALGPDVSPFKVQLWPAEFQSKISIREKENLQDLDDMLSIYMKIWLATLMLLSGFQNVNIFWCWTKKKKKNLASNS